VFLLCFEQTNDDEDNDDDDEDDDDDDDRTTTTMMMMSDQREVATLVFWPPCICHLPSKCLILTVSHL